MVVKNLKDHCYGAVGVALKQNPDFEEPSVPPLRPTPMAFLKSPVAMASEEFKNLPSAVQRHLSLPTVPNFEIAAVSLWSSEHADGLTLTSVARARCRKC